MRKTTAERFWAKVQIGKPDECWEWQGCRDGAGYGRFGLGTRRQGVIAAHRYVIGCEANDGVVAMHSCDNPPCVNPAHLRRGSKADNAADMAAKGRGRGGSDRLTDAQVLEIRQIKAAGDCTQSEIARRFGISPGHVTMILKGQRRALA